MDAKTRIKIVNALMSQYIKLYKDKYGVAPKFNRYTEKWGFDYLLEDLGSDAQSVIDYYFTLRKQHSSQDLLRNYQEINQWRIEDAEDEENRRKLAQETKARVEEYRAKWPQKPST